MSLADGLAVSHSATTQALMNRCREMVVLANEIQAALLIDPLKPVSTFRLEMKVTAIINAREIHNAVSGSVRIDNRKREAG